ncbi:MAG: 5'-nucleotidase C-terminal domain-containing protein, partial [Shewanella sp.]|nr:5'-nucleotidase C-terminal domain-containing protein [Shewanella sp.]MCF1432234.1 5'-nucleotidase C-terminal domain-containing protein [Shewanella sp.]MCF1440011.1 5'-nucleotidase C-terminal domain-containing protein [Shewanella sp.]MCF1457836.1 5'-nucleotidase C-terminal domain-containing protein [Shewanella sp.]
YADFKPGDECVPDQQNGTWIMQAYEWGKYVGRADFGFFNGKLELLDYRLIPVNLKVKDANGQRQSAGPVIPEDPMMLQILAPYQQNGEQLLDQRIAYSEVFLDGQRDSVRSRQTNLGYLMGEAFRNHELVKADFSVINAGSVRASIEPGVISYRDVLTVQPFGNFVTKATMTGSQLQRYLDKVTSLTGGGLAQLSNIRLDVDCDAGQTTIYSIGGRPFSPAETYSFAISGFSAAGGDGYPVIDVLNLQQTDAEVFRDYLQQKGTIVGSELSSGRGVRYFVGKKRVNSCAER